MNLIKQWAEHVGVRGERFFKSTLFSGDHLMVGLNCLEPGQVQAPHVHDNQDKFYLVMAGNGRFWLGEQQVEAGEGAVIWAPAGLAHGVENYGKTTLTLLVGMAPAP